MAKNKRQRRERRDFTTSHAISNHRLPLPVAFQPLRVIEDRRTWHPEGPRRPARSFNSSRHRLKAAPSSIQRTAQVPSGRFANPLKIWDTPATHQVAFERPQSVLVCVRRKIREQVLHALNKTGKRGQKRPRFSYYSSIKCKRR